MFKANFKQVFAFFNILSFFIWVAPLAIKKSKRYFHNKEFNIFITLHF
jgi:hypothetical protein